MAKPLRPKRGTTAKNDAFVGLASEITIDTDKHSIRVHDGVTAGGHEILPKAKNDLLYQEKGNYVTSVNGQTGAVVIESGSGGLPTAGGTMEGTVTFNLPKAINRDVDSSYLGIYGGTANNSGAYLTLWGKSSSEDGAFNITTMSSGNVTRKMIGKPSGVLTWDGKNIVRTVNNVTANTSGNVTLDVGVTSVNGQTGAVTINAGVTSVNGQTGDVTIATADTRIPLSGDRGTLAGYNVPQTKTNVIIISGNSNDDTIVSGAADVTVNNGTSSQTWAKTVALTSASTTVTLDDKWKWVGGNAPSVSANSILVLKWIGSFGLANLVKGE